MNIQRFALQLLVLLFASLAWTQQTFDWRALEKLAPGTLIVVKTDRLTVCSFQRATSDTLFCSLQFVGPDSKNPNGDRSFDREAVQSVRTINSVAQFKDENPDDSSGSLAIAFAAEAGGGWDTKNQPTTFAGVKMGSPILGFGGPFNMDLQYDRISGQNGFSVEGSGVLPLFRVPAFRPGEDRLLFKVYAEPGAGYRAGGGPFGGYASAKALVLFGSKWVEDGRPSPYIEFQRRFPFNSPLEGDNRIAAGIMWVLCDRCGLD
jgi:hypothetical protein